MVWMVTPLPVVTMPTMRSPGSGWQQPAKCSAMPGMRPRIGTAAPRLLAPCGRAAAAIGTDLAVGLRGGALRAGEDRVRSTSRPVLQPFADRGVEVLDRGAP